MRILFCMLLAALALVAAVRSDEPSPEKPVLTLPGRVVVKTMEKGTLYFSRKATFPILLPFFFPVREVLLTPEEWEQMKQGQNQVG